MSQDASAPSILSFSAAPKLPRTGLESSSSTLFLTRRCDAFAIFTVFDVSDLTTALSMMFVELNASAPPQRTLIPIPKLSPIIEGCGSPFFSMKPEPMLLCTLASA